MVTITDENGVRWRPEQYWYNPVGKHILTEGGDIVGYEDGAHNRSDVAYLVVERVEGQQGDNGGNE